MGKNTLRIMFSLTVFVMVFFTLFIMFLLVGHETDIKNVLVVGIFLSVFLGILAGELVSENTDSRALREVLGTISKKRKITISFDVDVYDGKIDDCLDDRKYYVSKSIDCP